MYYTEPRMGIKLKTNPIDVLYWTKNGNKIKDQSHYTEPRMGIKLKIKPNDIG